MKLQIEPILRLLVTLYGVFPVIGLPFWLSWLELDGELPPKIATHWGFTGQPDGFMSPSDFGVAMSIVFAVLWLLIVWLLWTKRLPRLTGWVIVLPILVIYLGMLNLVVQSVLDQRGLSDVTNAELPAGSFVFLILALPLILGFSLTMPKVSVTDEQLEASIWAIPIYRVALKDIDNMVQVELRARDYGGLGFRFGKHGFAIIPRPGAGIKITTRDARSIAIRCTNPSEIIEATGFKETE